MNDLYETELQYRAIFEQSPYGILLIDNKGRISQFNEAAHRDLGYTREEFTQLQLSDIDPVESQEEIEANINEVFNRGDARFEVKHRTKSGEIRDVHVITNVLKLSGKLYCQTIWRDITEHKQAKKALNRQREQLEELVIERTAELSLANKRLQEDIAIRQSDKLVREKLILELQEALANIKTLKGLLPMCAWCKKIRDDQGYWNKVESYIRDHSDVSFTHGICPDCLKIESPETYEEVFDTHDTE